jgi:PKD domain
MKRICLAIAIFIFIFESLFCQSNPVGLARYDNIWLNGWCDLCQDSMFGGSRMDFSTYPPKVSRESRDLDFYGVNASFSDAKGKLLFYFNGYYFANQLDDTLNNGGGINPDYSVYQDAINQAALTLPQPGNDSIIYVIHEKLTPDVNLIGIVKDCLYSIININKNNGLGEVIAKNISLLSDSLSYGQITATKHGNGRDWWIIIPKYDQPIFYKFLLTPHGIDTFPAQTIGEFGDKNFGQAVFSPDGTQYVRASSPGYDYGMWIDIFDFDRCSGEFSNSKGFHKIKGGTVGVSISPNSKYLYLSRSNKLYQYELDIPSPLTSEKTVATYDGFANPSQTDFFLSQLALDGKIYIGTFGSVKNCHVIHNPNEKGVLCNVEQHAITLPTISDISVSTFPYYRLGPLDGSVCDTLGINNLPIVDFRFDKTNDTLKLNFVDLSYYEPNIWHWDFGDGTSSSERNPVHVFPSNGVYNVCLIASNQYAADTICKKVVLGKVVSTFESGNLETFSVKTAPNPVKNEWRLYFTQSLERETRLQFFDVSGRLVFSKELATGTVVGQVELGDLPRGLLVWQLSQSGVLLKTGKLAKIE